MKLFTRTKLLLVHLSRRLKCTVVCLASLTFAFFISPLKPLNGTEFNEFWQETRSQSSLPSLCFWADRENKMAAPASDLLWHFRLLLWNRWTEFNESWQETRSQSPLPSVCFRADRENKMAARPLICWDIFDFSSETTERNSTKLDRKQDINVLYQICVFRANQTNKMTALSSDWLRHYRLLLWNRWTEVNETWQE